MSLTIKQLVQENNEKRKQLTKENDTYYEQLLVYIRSNLFREERATEELLYEMLDHILLAQEDGKNAHDVFGKEPKQLADELIDTLPKEQPKKTIGFFGENIMRIVGIYFAIVGIPTMFSDEENTLYVGSFLLNIGALIIGLFVVIGVVLNSLKKEAFASNNSKKLFIVIFTFTFLAVVGTVVVISQFANEIGPQLQTSPYTYFGFGCFLLLASYLFKMTREGINRKG